MKRATMWYVAVLVVCCLAGTTAWAGILNASGEPDPSWQGDSMLLWLKADAGFTASAWQDQSNHGYDAAQGNAAYQPSYSATGINGNPAILFDGDDHMLISSGPSGQQTAFFVYKDTSTATYVTPLGTVYDGSHGSYHGANTNTALFDGHTDPKTTGGSNARNGAGISNGYSTPRPDDWALDVHVATAPLAQVVSTIGGDNFQPWTRAINGGIAEVILYDRPLTASEVDQVGHYLETKYSIPTTYGSDLVSYWTFDDGTANDTVDGNHGTHVGSGVTPNVTGIVGKAMSYNDTTSAYITVPTPHTLNAATDATNEITMEAWVQPTQIKTGHTEIMRQQAPGYRFISFQSGGVQIMFNLEGSQLIVPITAADFEDGDWHHIAGTYDGTTQRLYIDGTEAGSKTISLNLSSSAPADFVIGNYRTTYGEPFGGSIDEVAVWDGALSADEVKHHWINRQPYTTRLLPNDTTHWNAHDDWDPTDGKPGEPPQRAWFYQALDAGQYSDLPNWGLVWGGGAWRNPGGYPMIGPRVGDLVHPAPAVRAYITENGLDEMKLVQFHPASPPYASNNVDGVFTWRNPVPGTNMFDFDGVFWHVDGASADGVIVSISSSEPFGLNDSVLPFALTGLGADFVNLNAKVQASPWDDFDFRLTLNYGDEVHFRVNANGALWSDASMFGCQVALVPEPATLALLVGGLGALAARRRRRR